MNAIVSKHARCFKCVWLNTRLDIILTYYRVSASELLDAVEDVDFSAALGKDDVQDEK